jgi:hypothetical protein
MAKNSGKDDNSPALHEEVKNLIIRKLRQQRRELEKQYTIAKRAVHAKFREGFLAHIRAGRTGQALIAAPLEAYKDLVVFTITTTKQWPASVWRSIGSILEKANIVPDGQEINAIVDEFAWAMKQNPFTLRWADAEKFQESVGREVQRYGTFPDEFTADLNRQLGLAAGAARCGILSTAKQAREGAGIVIAEYLITPRTTIPSGNLSARSGTRREFRKLETQDRYKGWQKKYRLLKTIKPNRTDAWYSQQIAKLDIACGRSADTIRKHMK